MCACRGTGSTRQSVSRKESLLKLRAARMGKRNATRVTAADIAKMGDGGVDALIEDLVKKAATGDSETKER